jgi:hypothetical protein
MGMGAILVLLNIAGHSVTGEFPGGVHRLLNEVLPRVEHPLLSIPRYQQMVDNL